MRLIYFLLCFIWLSACSNPIEKVENAVEKPLNPPTNPYLVVLGVAQDAGFPQANCQKDCCREVWKNPSLRKKVSCIALVEPSTQQAWIFDATPSFRDQLKDLEQLGVNKIAGIFLTHAHVGHYTGLTHLGREIMGTNGIPVYAMPKMSNFLENNGPWSQLVALENIKIQALQKDSSIQLGNGLSVTPYQVPHRDEYSETVGFQIKGANQSAIFIPDIDKWQKWDKDINQVIQQNTIALLDGSFYQNGEIPGRDMSLIPHPFVVESMDLFKKLSDSDKGKVHFIHFNHTNPILLENSAAQKEVLSNGFQIAKELQFFEM